MAVLQPFSSPELHLITFVMDAINFNYRKFLQKIAKLCFQIVSYFEKIFELLLLLWMFWMSYNQKSFTYK